MRGFGKQTFDDYQTQENMLSGGTQITPFELDALQKGYITKPGTYTGASKTKATEEDFARNGGIMGYGRGQAMARTSAQELQSLIQSQDRSVYLKDYSYDKLAKDIKGGKLKREIAKELYNKNPKYYDKLPRLKDAAGRPIDIITTGCM